MSGTVTSNQGFFWNDTVTPESATDLESTFLEIQNSGTAAVDAATAATAAAASAATAASAAATAASGAVTTLNAAASTAVATINSTVTSATTTLNTAATAAASNASAAATSASAAASSATTAGTAATSAGTSATNAGTSASAAAGSATTAATSASNAATSATAAATSAASAAGRVDKTGDTMTGALVLPSLHTTANATVDGTLNLGTAGGNSIIQQSGTGVVFGMNMANTSSQFRVSNSGTNYLTVSPSLGNVPLGGAQAPSFVATNGAFAVNKTAGYRYAANLTGTTTDTPAYANFFFSPSDVVAAANGLSYVGLVHHFGGASTTGDRNTLDITSTLVAPTGNTSGGTNWSGIRVTTTANDNDTGTALTPLGTLWAINAVATTNTPASGTSYFNGVVGIEVDVAAQANATVLDKFGITIIQLTGDAVRGSRTDNALTFDNQNGATGWLNGMVFGCHSGQWPMASSGSLITIQNAVIPSSTHGNTAAYGVDFRLGSFSGLAFASPGYQVTGAGVVSIGTGKLTPTARACPSMSS
jgi:hypothetical protein